MYIFGSETVAQGYIDIPALAIDSSMVFRSPVSYTHLTLPTILLV